MSELSLQAVGLGKMYKIFPTRRANLLDALGVRARRSRYKEFWALRGLDIDLARGKRLGIVGRNGAGKSTFLKLITGNIAPTEGTLVVNGGVQALIEAGAGFHPEFTGEENIRASLTLQGVDPGAMKDFVAEIADFTELGDFLTQPFRTYSAGMQARLAFATATTVEPEILIVDEMLSAGDAYFSVKAGERMRGLVDSGASLLLVSHSLEHITMFCEEAIWLDRGKIVDRGSSLEVVKAYQQFTRLLDERRIRARNRKALSGAYASHELENYADQIVARVTPLGTESVHIEEVGLFRSEEREERVRIGDAQDANTSLDAHVIADGWSDPASEGDRHFRELAPGSSGLVVFNLFSVYDDSSYEIEVALQAPRDQNVRIELLHDGMPKASRDITATGHTQHERVSIDGGDLIARHVGAEVVGPRPKMLPEGFAGDGDTAALRELRRWPGEGRIAIEEVRTSDGTGSERTVFERGSELTIEVGLAAKETGTFPIVLGLSIYRIDGLLVTNHASPPQTFELAEGDSATFSMTLPTLNLGNGRYTFSVAAFRELEPGRETKVYDLLDRSFEFEVFGNAAFENGVFTHPAVWSASRHPSLTI
jgi:lipopolysaccharide transport system ATP-binding protein